MKVKDIKNKVKAGTEFWMKVKVVGLDGDGYAHFDNTAVTGCLFQYDAYTYHENEIKEVQNLDESKEMTVKQIEEILGHSIKIIK